MSKQQNNSLLKNWNHPKVETTTESQQSDPGKTILETYEYKVFATRFDTDLSSIIRGTCIHCILDEAYDSLMDIFPDGNFKICGILREEMFVDVSE